MSVDVYVPLVVSVLFGLIAPPVSRRLPPAQATWLVSLGGALVALSTALSLGLLAFMFIGQQRPIAELGTSR